MSIKYIDSNSFGTKVYKLVESGFTSKGLNDSNHGYDFNILTKEGYIGSYDTDMVESKATIPDTVETVIVNAVSGDTLSKSVRADSFVEKSIIRVGNYIYPLDKDLKGYNLKEFTGYNDVSKSLNYKKDIKVDSIDGMSSIIYGLNYNYYDNSLKEMTQPYDKIISVKPHISYDGMSSYTSPIKNYLQFDVGYHTDDNGNKIYSDELINSFSDIYNVKRINTSICLSDDAISIDINNSRYPITFFKKFNISETGTYTFSVYLKGNENIKICSPKIKEYINGSFDESTFYTNYGDLDYDLSYDWKRYSVTQELISNKDYVLCFYVNNETTIKTDIRIAGFLLEKKEVSSKYISEAVSYIKNVEKNDYHALIALKLVNEGITFPTKFCITYIRKCTSGKPCFDMLGNIKYGYGSDGYLYIDGNKYDNMSSHIGELEHIVLSYDSGTCTFKSISNSGDTISRTFTKTSFVNSIDIANSILGTYTANIILGASIDSKIVTTCESTYRNLIFSNGSIPTDFKYLLNPSFELKNKDKSMLLVSDFIEEYFIN